MMREEDLEDIIKRDIRFDIYNDELDLLFQHYGEGCRRGYVDYKLFDEDIHKINKRKRRRSHSRTEEKSEEEKVEEIPISVRPPKNISTDTRYSMRNTITGMYPETRKEKKYKIKISDIILQDLIKATYLRDIYVEDAFIKFAKPGREHVVNQKAIQDTFTSLGLKIDSKTAKDTYDKLVGNAHALTPHMIDLAVEDNSKKGIEEIQKLILELIHRSIKAHPEITIKEVFLKYDRGNEGRISFKEFENSIKNYVPKIKSMYVLFLAKRY